MRLGRTHVDAMLRGLTAKQFFEWRAYAALEPFDEMRADYRAARIAQTIANVMGRGKDDPPYELEDFVVKWKDENGDVGVPTKAAELPKTDEEQALAKSQHMEKMMRMMFGVPLDEL